MKQKKKIIIFAIIVIIVIVAVIIFAKGRNNNEPEVLEDGTVVSKSPKLKETKKYEGFEITNLNVSANESLTTISGDVKNVKDTEVNSQYIGIKAYDDKGEVVATFEAIIAPPGDLKGRIAPGDVITFNASTTERVTNIYDLEFVAPTQTEVVVPDEDENATENKDNKTGDNNTEKPEENNK